MHILTITLNAAVDATYGIDCLVRGGANRVGRLFRMPGGKGNNVARVLCACGHAVTATGFLGGSTGEFIEARLGEAGVTPRFTWLENQESRTCHTILDEASGEATEILEPGPEVSAEDRERFLRHLPELMAAVDAVVISGSAPAGLPAAFLERLAMVVRTGTPRMIVDSSGVTLTGLLAGRPNLIKPNLAEIETLMGRSASTQERIAFARDDLIAKRMSSQACVLISMGGDGAVLVSRSDVYRARPPAIRPVNTVGCGDAMLAGYVDAWLTEQDRATLLRQAVAFGAAAALQPVAGVINQKDVERIRLSVDLIEDAGPPIEQRMPT
jgi:tagatose 6-phosphate kinase